MGFSTQISWQQLMPHYTLSGHLIHYFPLHEQSDAGWSCGVLFGTPWTETRNTDALEQQHIYIYICNICIHIYIYIYNKFLILGRRLAVEGLKNTHFTHKTPQRSRSMSGALQQSSIFPGQEIWKTWTKIGSRPSSWAETFTRPGSVRSVARNE